MIHIPAGVLRVLNNAKINWNFLSEGEPGTAGRQLQWPRGKTLGGTSSINGMLYVRGNPADYENWAQMGCRGWSYDEVLPFFRKSETYRGKGEPEYRSQGGPLIVEDYRTIPKVAAKLRKKLSCSFLSGIPSKRRVATIESCWKSGKRGNQSASSRAWGIGSHHPFRRCAAFT
jgi:choline dehydrogenase-like flavoprotein